MNGGETNADDPTASRPPFDALSAILQKSSGGNSTTGFGIISGPEIQLSPFGWAMTPITTDRTSPIRDALCNAAAIRLCE
jgi:hypothetical protein